jgi:RNA polymerase sigma factor (sigma-70 family)
VFCSGNRGLFLTDGPVVDKVAHWCARLKLESKGLVLGNESLDKSDESRFEAIFRACWPSVYQLAYRLVGERAEAEDIAVEAFFRLYVEMQERGEHEVPRAWLYRVVLNLGLNSLRSRCRRSRYQEAAGRDIGQDRTDQTPLEQAQREEQRRLVHSVLARLKPRSARLLVLRYSGFSYAELAQALSLSRASVGTLLARAEREFEREFKAMTEKER